MLFDYGGVLADEGFQQGLTEIARQNGLPPEQLIRLAIEAVYDSGYVLGQGDEAEIFREVARRLNLTPREILFIDDSPGNIQRAETEGLITLLFRDREQFEQDLKRLIRNV